MAEEKYPINQPEREASQKESPEIKELKERLEKLEVRLEKERAPEEKEKMAKQEIKEYLMELQQSSSSSVSPMVTRDETEEIKKFEPSQQVGALISLVFEKGLAKAVSLARDLDNPAILDEFHDALVDHYFQTLIEKKILR